MRFYHGTIAEFAEGIKREGLQAKTSNAFQISHWFNGPLRDFEEVKPHVTTLREHAANYAKFRAEYEASEPGTELMFNHVAVGLEVPFVKETSKKRRNPKPVLVEFDIPKSWAKQHLEEDIQDREGQSVIADVPIPAKFVTGVEEVRMEAA